MLDCVATFWKDKSSAGGTKQSLYQVIFFSKAARFDFFAYTILIIFIQSLKNYRPCQFTQANRSPFKVLSRQSKYNSLSKVTQRK